MIINPIKFRIIYSGFLSQIVLRPDTSRAKKAKHGTARVFFYPKSPLNYAFLVIFFAFFEARYRS